MKLEIVWRNPSPPPHRMFRLAEIAADESTSGSMWVIRYQAIPVLGWPENEYQLFVKRNFKRRIAV